MTSIDLRFSTGLTARGPALNAIAGEMAAAFNAVRAGFGDAILAEARALFPQTPMSFSIEVSDYAPQQSGPAGFTLVWAQLAQITGTPLNPIITPYGHMVDLRMDLAATTVTLTQFENAVRNKWRTLPDTRTALEPWKRAKRVEAGEADDVTEKVTKQVGDVCYHEVIEFQHHGFYDRLVVVV